MFLKRTLAGVCAGILAVAGICGAIAQQQVTIDKMVAVVGESVVLYSDLVEAKQMIAEEYRQQGITSDRNPDIEALEHLMLQKLLYNQALLDSLTVDQVSIATRADEYVYELADQLGGVPALEDYFHQAIFQIKQIVTQRYTEQEYASQMRYSIQGDVTITPGEVDRFFRTLSSDELPVIPEQYVYAQITMKPLSAEEAKQRTRERLLALREDIIMNGRNFAILARTYSQEPGAVRSGGEIGYMTENELDPAYSAAMVNLQPGQVSGVVESSFGFHIIQMIDRQGNRYNTRHILMRPEFTAAEIDETNARLDSLAQEIRAGNITFEAAAEQNSADKYSKFNGGLASNMELVELRYGGNVSYATTKHFAEDIPGDIIALRQLSPGEISEAFSTTDVSENVISKIVKLVEIIPQHRANMSEDYLRLQEFALNDKVNREFQTWLNSKIDAMYVRIDPAYRIPDEFEIKAWLK